MAGNETEVGGIKVGLELDTASLSKNMTELNSKIQAIRSEFKQASDGTKAFAQSAEGLTVKNSTLNRELEVQQMKLQELKRRYDEANAAEKRNEKEIDKLATMYNNTQGQINKLNREITENTKKLQDQASGFAELEKKASVAVVGIDGKLKTLNSRFDATTAGIKDFGKSQEDLRMKADHLNTTIGLQEKKAEALKTVYDHLRSSKGEDAASTQKAERAYNAAIGTLNRTKTALNDIEHELDQQGNKWNILQKKVHGASEGMAGVGDKFNSIGQSAAAVSIPIVASGALMAKSAIEMNDAQGKIQASLGLTEAQAAKLTKTAQGIYNNGFGESMGEVEDAVIKVKQNMDNLNAADLKQVTQGALTLSKLFNADVNETTRTGAALMRNFGIDSGKAMDIMTTGFQKGGDFSGELLDTLNEYSSQFASAGLSADQMLSILITGAKAGAFNMDKVGDAVKEFNLRAQDQSKTTAAGFKAIGLNVDEMAQAIASGGEKGEHAFQATLAGLAAMKDPVAQNTAGVNLFGTQWEDVRKNVVLAMSSATTNLIETEGATKRASAALQDTFSVKAKAALRDFGQAFLPLGNELLDMAQKYLPDVQRAVAKLTEFIKGMSPEAKEAAIKFAAFAAVLAPIAVMIGGVISAGSGLVGMLGALAPAAGLAGGALGAGAAAGGGVGLAGAIAAIAPPVAIAVAALAALTVAGIALHKHYTASTIPAVDLFGDKVSKSTAKAVGAYMDLNTKATKELNSFEWSGKAITKRAADSIGGTFDQMGKKIVTGMQKTSNQQLNTLQTFFATSKTLTSKEEADIIQKHKDSEKLKEAAVKAGTKRINQILEDAGKHHRQLKEKEKKEIADIQAAMMNQSIKTLSKSEVEQKQIMNNLARESGKISAKQAADVVRESVKAKDGAVKAANEKFKKVQAAIIQERDGAHSISKKKADEVIAEADRERKKAIEKATDMNKQVVAQAKKQAKGHEDQISWESGKVLTNWQKMVRDSAKGTNDLIEKINWLLKKLKLPTIPKVSVPKYAKGTKNHKGGAAIVGEEGYELAHVPKVGVTVLGAQGEEMVNLPAGTSVLPHKQSKAIVEGKGNNIPMYEGGVGDFLGDVWDGTKKVASKAKKSTVKTVSKAKDKVVDTAENAEDFLIDIYSNTKKTVMDALNIKPPTLNFGLEGVLPAFFKNAKDGAVKLIEKGLGDFGGAVTVKGSGVKRWQPYILKAAAMMKESVTPAQVNGILAQIQRESGGNEKITQSSAVRDINTRNGNPARGLLQYIPQTFRAYALKGHGNIYSGFDQLLAFFNNTKWRKNLPYGKRGWGPTGKRKFANGGLINQHQMLEAGEEGNEMIIPLVGKRRKRALDLWIQTGQMLGALGMSADGKGGATTTGTTNINNTSNDKYELHFHFPEGAVTTTSGKLDYKAIAENVQKELQTLNKMNNRYQGVIIQ
jgi:phage-related minor tail protein/SLT domain-containing protein